MPVKFEDNTIKVEGELAAACLAWLYEAAGEFQAQTQRNSPVDMGQLKGSWKYKVNDAALEAVIGSPLENAIWNEFGTGHYALKGNGRKTPWYVPVDGFTGKKKPTYFGRVVVIRGKNGKFFYKTNGKRPRRSLYNSYISLKDKVPRALEDKLRRMSGS